MKTKLLAWIVALALVVSPAVAADQYKINSEKSKVDFVGKKKDGQHKGGFKKISGEGVADHDAPEKGSLKMTIDTTSLWSDDAKLTDHLKNPDFFHVSKHPTITFESTKIELKGETEANITGKLTMLGKTVETTVPVKVAMPNENTLELTATFKIDRTKWGMNYGEGKIEKDVELVASIVMNK